MWLACLFTVGRMEIDLLKPSPLGRAGRGEGTLLHSVRSNLTASNDTTDEDQNRQGLHNFCHPRTDMVVIAATVDPAREKILLGRNVGHLCALLVIPNSSHSRMLETLSTEVLLRNIWIHRAGRVARGCNQT